MLTFSQIRIEILLDGPLVPRITALAEAAGIERYMLISTLGGLAAEGRWRRDEVTGTTAKQLFVATIAEPDAERLLTALSPFIASHGLQLVATPAARLSG
ncbi:MAG: hypothetical protein ACMVO5_03190 [Polymorphobacter sp.]|uniref:hypothetical protein n=1 Tax=Polymorphobacter sp. TaxID=1909290 RepID=UPI003A8C6624